MGLFTHYITPEGGRGVCKMVTWYDKGEGGGPPMGDIIFLNNIAVLV